MWKHSSTLMAIGMLSAFLAVARPTAAQPYVVDWWTADGGGAMGLAGGTFVVSGTAGQPDAGGPFAGGAFVVHGGFWAGLTATSGTSQTDLSITIADAPDPVPQGGTLTYTVQAANGGPAASTGMTVVTTLPPGVTFLSSTPGAPVCISGTTVTCTLGGLAPGSSHTITIRVGVASPPLSVLAAGAVVTGLDPDPTGANNSASAQTLVIALARGELAHGTCVRADLAAAGPLPDIDLYRIRQEPHASYEVIVDAASGDVGAGAGPALQRVGPDGATVLQPSLPVGAGPARSLRWANTATAAVADQLVRVSSAACGTDCGPDDVYRLRAYETTGTIPRFNNSASQVTVVVIQNTGPEPVDGRLYFWSPAGALLHQQTIALAPRALFSLNTSGVAALSGTSGSITLASDAPYGTLAGKAVALEPATGYSFDSVMAPRLR